MRSVLITGTSTGIGQATAVTLAARGWRVFATMRNLEKRGRLEQALKEAGERCRLHRPAHEFDLLCIEMGGRRLG
jgi:NAD(P)-dependent dehydrogenase (short-subunit alcohol dehydrogenase family)